MSETIGIEFEKRAMAEGYRLIAGVDEVGRGCLAGAVVAAACILDLSKPLPEFLNDSKKLSAKKREKLDAQIKENAVAYAIGQIEADEIDRINILQATKKAMIHGDAISASIAAASILAKNYRDNLMTKLDKIYPVYGFAKHVGYGTKAHFEALREHGACEIHRKSFRGVII